MFAQSSYLLGGHGRPAIAFSHVDVADHLHKDAITRVVRTQLALCVYVLPERGGLDPAGLKV